MGGLELSARRVSAAQQLDLLMKTKLETLVGVDLIVLREREVWTGERWDLRECWFDMRPGREEWTVRHRDECDHALLALRDRRLPKNWTF